MVALLFFLMCAMVGSVILAAAATSSGRTSKAKTEENIERYSLESAAQLIADDMTGREANTTQSSGDTKTSSSTIKDPDTGVEFKQNWSFRTVTSNFLPTEAASSKAVRIGDQDYYLYDSNEYTVPDVPQVSAGDFVLRLDQTQASGKSKYSMKVPTELTDTGNDLSYQWNDAFVQQASTTTGTSDTFSNYVTVDPNTHGVSMLKQDLGSFRNLRNVMAMAIYRNYWYAMNQTDSNSQGTIESTTYSQSSPLTTNQDPWSSSKLNMTWDSVVSTKGDYTISTDAPLVIDFADNEGETKDNESLVPVYIGITMDESFVMTFHLYCDKNGGDDQGLYLIYKPAENMPSLTYTSNNKSDTESPYTDHRIVGTYVGNMTLAADSKEALRAEESQYILNNIKEVNTQTETENSSGNTQKIYSFDYYTKLDVTRTTTATTREVDFTVTWQSGELTSRKPD